MSRKAASGAKAPSLAPSPSFTRVTTALLQRKCTCGLSGGKDDDCEESKKKSATTMRRKVAGRNSVATAPSIVHEALRSPGQPLDAATRAFFEPRFGHAFQNVRVHTDARAAESARAVDAFAYTAGQDIVFAEGVYQPGTTEGRRLLAHELVHTVQQYHTGHPESAETKLSDPKDLLEHQAEMVADSITGGRCNSSLSRAFPLVASNQPLVARAGGPALPGPSPVAKAKPDTVKVWLNSFIPDPVVKQPVFGTCLRGDNRTFTNSIKASYRTHQEIEFDVSTLARIIDYADTGVSTNLDCNTLAVTKTAKAPTTGLTNGPVTRSGSDILVDFKASAKDPLLAIACDIDLDVQFHVNPVTRQCYLTGNHDGFPAYEAYVTEDNGAGVPVYRYDPVAAGEGPMALCGGLDKTILSKPVTF